MFRKLFAIFLLVIFSLVSFSNNLLLLDYKLHTRNYLRHCENKYRPSLHCNGQCQLMKKLKAREDKEQKQAPARVETSLVLFIPVQPETSAVPVTDFFRHFSCFLPAPCVSGYSAVIFQPPRC